MSGKWTERGIECEHEPSHLVADKDGVVVCNKRKGQRQEIPVGRMIAFRPTSIGIVVASDVPIGTELLRRLRDPKTKDDLSLDSTEKKEFDKARRSLQDANAVVRNAEERARDVYQILRQRFREIIYKKGLAVWHIDTLHDGLRFRCPGHKGSRIFWEPENDFWGITVFRRKCLKCSLNPAEKTIILKECPTIDYAYECSFCGIVLGEYKTAGDIPGHQKFYCKLCETELGTDIS